MSRSWSGLPCSCPARRRPSSTDIRSMSMVASPPVSRFVPLECNNESRRHSCGPRSAGRGARTRGSRCGTGRDRRRGRRHLRIGSALFQPWRLRHGAGARADDPRSRGRRHHQGAGCVGIGARDRRPRRGFSEPALQRLRLLPEGPAEPVPEHALLRQRDADAAHSGSVSSASRRGSLAMPQGRRRCLDQRSGLCGAVRGRPACRQPRRIVARQTGSRDGMRPDRRLGDRGCPAPRCAGDRRDRRHGGGSGKSARARRRSGDQCR